MATTWKPSLRDSIYKSKKFKKTWSLKRGLTSPDQIRSEREKESDQREGDQIREKEKEKESNQITAWVARRRQGRATWGSRGLGLTQPGSRGLGLARPRPPGSHGLRFTAAWVDLIFAGFFLRRHFFFFFSSSSDFIFAGDDFLLYIGL